MCSNPFYSEFLRGVEYTARLSGYHVIISGVDADERFSLRKGGENLDLLTGGRWLF